MGALRSIAAFFIGLEPKVWLMVVVAAAAVSVIGYIHINDKRACEIKSLNKTIEGVKIHDRVESKVITLTDPDLDRQLSHWMRD